MLTAGLKSLSDPAPIEGLGARDGSAVLASFLAEPWLDAKRELQPYHAPLQALVDHHPGLLQRIPTGARSVHRDDHHSGERAVKVGLNASQHAALHLPETALDSRLSESLFCLPGLEVAECIREPEDCHLFRAKLKVEGLGLSGVLLSSSFACPHAVLRRSRPASARALPHSSAALGIVNTSPGWVEHVEPCCQLCAAKSWLHLKTQKAEVAAHSPLLRRGLSCSSCPAVAARNSAHVPRRLHRACTPCLVVHFIEDVLVVLRQLPEVGAIDASALASKCRPQICLPRGTVKRRDLEAFRILCTRSRSGCAQIGALGSCSKQTV